MKHCETCLFWEKVDPRKIPYEDMNIGGFCQSPHISEEYGYSPISLVYSYSEGGQFWTGPKFGCVNHVNL